MVLSEPLYTADEFLALVATPAYDGKRLELIEGEIIEMPPSSHEVKVSRRAWCVIWVNLPMITISVM